MNRHSETRFYKATTGPAASQTRKGSVDVDVTGLKGWPEIPALRNVSGIGTYSTSFDLPASWTSGHGAMLSLGEVFDTYTLAVNGQTIPIGQLSAEADVGPYLHAGRNSISLRVTTTLNNRLAAWTAPSRSAGSYKHMV